MNDLLAAASGLQSFCDAQGWQSCIIGGLAVHRWGETRATRDVDLVLLTRFGEEGPFIDLLLQRYDGRISNAGLFARETRVLLLQSQDGIGIDISLAALPFEELVIERATDYSFGPNVSLRTCSAEDLLVMKLFAFRPIDLRDADSIALRNRAHIDWDYVQRQLTPLADLKEDARILQELARLRQELAQLKDAPAYPPT